MPGEDGVSSGAELNEKPTHCSSTEIEALLDAVQLISFHLPWYSKDPPIRLRSVYGLYLMAWGCPSTGLRTDFKLSGFHMNLAHICLRMYCIIILGLPGEVDADAGCVAACATLVCEESRAHEE